MPPTNPRLNQFTLNLAASAWLARLALVGSLAGSGWLWLIASAWHRSALALAHLLPLVCSSFLPPSPAPILQVKKANSLEYLCLIVGGELMAPPLPHPIHPRIRWPSGWLALTPLGSGFICSGWLWLSLTFSGCLG